jgi:hypothetical protein
LHTNTKPFTSTTVGDDSSTTLLVNGTTNSYHLNASFDVSGLVGHARAPANASIELGMFVLPTSGTKAGQVVTLLPPWSEAGQAPLKKTSLRGELLKGISGQDPAASSAGACTAACVANTACGGWTFVENPTLPDASRCQLMKHGARVLANVGSGCDALGHSGCTSGIVGWQLDVPATVARIGVLLPPGPGVKTVTLELFVDQQICELFLHDGRGHGSAASTFGCSSADGTATAVDLRTVGVGGVKVSGALSDMKGSILPAPPM